MRNKELFQKSEKIGVVILNYNSHQETINLVNSLNEQSSKENLIVVVVDNCSTDNSYVRLQSLKRLNIELYIIKTKSNLGYAKGNNYGLKFLMNMVEYVAILNNDVIISDSQLFDRLLNRFRSLKNPAFIAPAEVDEHGSYNNFCARKKPTFVGEILNCFLPYTYFFGKKKASYTISKNSSEIEVEILSGAFLFTQYDYFHSIKFFDPGTFLFMEERILHEKVKRSGRKQYLIANINYIHLTSLTINQTLSNVEQAKIFNMSLLYYVENYLKNGILKAKILKSFLRFKIIQIQLKNYLKFRRSN